MTISDLTLKLEVYQKTLEKKRQQNKQQSFIEATYTSLTAQSLSSAAASLSSQISSNNNSSSNTFTNITGMPTSLSSSSSLSSIATTTSTSTADQDLEQHSRNKNPKNILELKPNGANSEQQAATVINGRHSNGNMKVTNGDEKIIVLNPTSECSSSPTLSSNSSSTNSSSSASPTSTSTQPPPSSSISSSSSTSNHLLHTENGQNLKLINSNGTNGNTPIKSLHKVSGEQQQNNLLIDTANLDGTTATTIVNRLID